MCPYSKQKLQKQPQKMLEKIPNAPTGVVPTLNRLDGPPGFPPLFPELPPEERVMAIQYVSHSNETERQARILRVQQSIESEKSNPPAVLTKISHDINKEKGHVFGYGASSSGTVVEKPFTHTKSAPTGDRIQLTSEVLLW